MRAKRIWAILALLSLVLGNIPILVQNVRADVTTLTTLPLVAKSVVFSLLKGGLPTTLITAYLFESQPSTDTVNVCLFALVSLCYIPSTTALTNVLLSSNSVNASTLTTTATNVTFTFTSSYTLVPNHVYGIAFIGSGGLLDAADFVDDNGSTSGDPNSGSLCESSFSANWQCQPGNRMVYYLKNPSGTVISWYKLNNGGGGGISSNAFPNSSTCSTSGPCSIGNMFLTPATPPVSGQSVQIEGPVTGQCPNNPGGTTCKVVLNTTMAGDLIIAYGVGVASTSCSISDTASLTWTNRANHVASQAATVWIDEWYAKSSGILTSDIITVCSNDGGLLVFGVSNTLQKFDLTSPTTATPATGTTISVAVRTPSPNDFTVIGEVHSLGSPTTAGSCCTIIQTDNLFNNGLSGEYGFGTPTDGFTASFTYSGPGDQGVILADPIVTEAGGGGGGAGGGGITIPIPLTNKTIQIPSSIISTTTLIIIGSVSAILLISSLPSRRKQRRNKRSPVF